MLLTINLKAGVYATVDRKGQHINLVQASGLIRISARNASGQQITTDMVAGMAIDAGEFIQCNIKSDNDQVILIWISPKPLNYSPDVSRAVGSGSLQSTVAQVFSNEPMQILPPVTGRNRITLTPTEDMFLGGVNLNLENGVKIAGGTTFTLATQGAVYGLETSGNYAPEYIAALTEDDIKNVQPLVDGNGDVKIITMLYASSTGRYFAHLDNTTARSLTEIDPSKFPLFDPMSTTTFSGQSVLNPDKVCIYDDVLYIPSYESSFGSGILQKFDLKTGVLTQETIVPAPLDGNENNLMSYAQRGNLRVVLDSKGYIYTSENNAAWTKSAASADSYAYHVAIFENDEIFVLGSNKCARTTNKGATWTDTANYPNRPAVNFSGSFKNDKGTLYTIGGSQKLVKSIDKGETWQNFYSQSESSFDLAITSFDIRDGLLLAAAAGGVVVAHDNQGALQLLDNNWSQANNTSAQILPTGAYFAGYKHAFDTNEYQYLAFGEKIATGGLKVAILEELN